MQRHGGSNRSVPKTAQSKLSSEEQPKGAAIPAPRQPDEDRDPAVKPKQP
jgi:hypothetical protein